MKSLLRPLFVIGFLVLCIDESYSQIVLGNIPPDIFVECDGTIPPPANVFVQSNNCDDDLPEVLFLESIVPSGICDGNYTIERTWSASNSCGATVSHTQYITVIDIKAPTLTAPPDITISCEDGTDPQNTGFATAFDACGLKTLTFTDILIPGSCPGFYSIERLWTATDACENQRQRSQMIMVEDTTSPILIGVPNDLVVSSQSEVPAPVQVTATDNCGTTTVTFNETQTGDVITRTWTATDECGNSSSDSQVITIEVPVAPVITVPADVFLECGESTDPSETGVAVSIGGCGGTIISYIDQTIEGSCPGEYTINRTWTATDECSNEDSQTQIIEVQDTSQPALVGVPEDISVQCSEEVPPPAEVTAFDFCDGPVEVTLAESKEWGENQYEYRLRRTWTATDACGNTASAEQIISVEDITAPVLEGVPGDIIVNCDEVPPPAEVIVIDNCENGVTLTFEETRIDGSCENSYTLIRTWYARDAVGNNVTSTQEISVEDTTPPELLTASVIILEANAECSVELPVLEYEVTDNCSSWTVTQDPPEFTLLQGLETFQVTLTATDECGNSSASVVEVTVVDQTAPVIDTPEDFTQGNDPDVCAAEVILPDLIIDDNCEIATIENDSPGLFPVGSTTVTWTVTDVNGNVNTAEQVVIVTNEAPVINTLTGPTGPIVEGAEIFVSGTFMDNNLVSARVDWGDGQSSEALIVGEALSSSYTYSVPGSYNIIVTLEDACGETAERVIENVEVIGSSFEGFVKGAGFFNSPQGSYKPNPNASGRFLFGFLVKNRERYDHPKGGTIFFFRAGRMVFSSNEYQYLRVNEGEAIYEGTGRVNRRKNFQFKVTAIDGQASSTDEYISDAIKIKIWNEDEVIYENELTEIYAGHIWIYPYARRMASARTVAPETYQEVDETTPTIEELISEYGESNIMAYPNPFNESINIEYIPLMTGRTSVKIYDLQGRIVTTIFDGEVEEFLPLNWEFKPDEYLDNGVYLLRIQDGLLPQTIRLNYHR